MTYANGEQQNDDTVEIDMQEASAMTGLHLTTVLDKDACSEIAEALGLDQKEIEHIHRRLCNAKAHEDFGWLFTLSASAVFHNLKKMADNLAAIAMELELGGGTLQIFLDLALFCSGDIKQHPEVRQILNTLARYQFDTRSRSSARSADHSAPRPLEFFDHSKFFDACMERYQKSVDGNFTLALIEVLKEAVNKITGAAARNAERIAW